jgi:hypothetical protein
VVTATGTTNTLDGESGLTFNGSSLSVSSNAQILNLIGTDHVYAAFYPDGSGAGRKAYIGYGGAADDNLTIANETGSGHIILSPVSTKNVGISTTSPSTKLHVYGDPARITIQSSTRSWFIGTDNSPAGIYFPYDNTAGASRMFIDTSGNVGIGTTSPNRILHIVKSDTGNAFTTSASINITNGDSAAFGRTVGVHFSVGAGGMSEVFAGVYGAYTNYTTSVGGDILFATNNGSGTLGEKMRVTSAGRVGIGNTGPSYTLDVTGDARVNTGALGVNVAPNATDGRIDASNDIVAFSSDRRLKTNIENITDALGKIKSLSGFTYNWNKVANTVAGFDTESRYVGVYAQEVQAVLPEAIKLAPFDNDGHDKSISGENYLTVQYEKLVPLLIEAIKELKKEVDELKKGKTE